MFDSKAQFCAVNFLGSKGMVVLGIVVTIAALINAVITIVSSLSGLPELIYPRTPVNPSVATFLFVLAISLHSEHGGFFARQCTKHMTSKHKWLMRFMCGLLATLCLILLVRSFDYALVGPREPNYFQKEQALMDKVQAVIAKAQNLQPIKVKAQEGVDTMRRFLEEMKQNISTIPPHSNDTAVSLTISYYERALAEYLENLAEEMEAIMKRSNNTDTAPTIKYNNPWEDAVRKA
ncbi:uncharacterized protein LOC129584291 [Paramacrobiotus metropolitanus]|uniref:uncharacterized protein LOC129584291 n=1 Tax=Paramacrobiotus metropolitanus TaxID=2943436 RepID=UPI002445D931|nr:uncharacterized protein LOC129584291 [Paramacrobiotus metropolitanus]